MSDTSGSVNTNDVAKELANSDAGQQQKLSAAGAQRILLSFFEIVAGHVSKGETVRLHNFGNVKVLPTKERKGKNPQTKEQITIKAGKRVHLAVSQHLKDAANTGKVPTREPRQRKAPDKPASSAKSAPDKPAKAAPAGAKTGGFRPQGAAPAKGNAADADKI